MVLKKPINQINNSMLKYCIDFISLIKYSQKFKNPFLFFFFALYFIEFV